MSEFIKDKKSGLYVPTSVHYSRVRIGFFPTELKISSTAAIAVCSLLISGLSAFFSYWSASQSDIRFKLDERPWLEIASIAPANGSDPSSPKTFQIFLQNFGKTSAKNVVVQGQIASFEDAPSDSEISELQTQRIIFRQTSSWGDFFDWDWIRTKIRPESGRSTSAHRTLPFGTMVRVTDTSSGKIVTVRIDSLVSSFDEFAPVNTTFAPGFRSSVPIRLTSQPGLVFVDSPRGSFIYLVGRVGYDDSFDHHHDLMFCFRILSSKGDLEAAYLGNHEEDK